MWWTVALVISSSEMASDVQVIPQPKVVHASSGRFELRPGMRLAYSHDQLKGQAEAFRDDLQRLSGVRVVVRKAEEGDIRFVLSPSPATSDLEHYRLKIDKGILVRAGSPTGVAWGASTLLQTFQKGGWNQMEIEDRPDKGYRGLLVDVARKYHDIDSLKQIVHLCHLVKVRFLQLHLTDDQAFTFPFQAFPAVNQQNRHGGPSYTRKELHELVAYADARGLAIVPEIEMPGHAGALIRANPDLFQIKGTQPYLHHASINFAKPEVVDMMKKLVREAAEVFHTSPYIHLGGDEADISLAHQNADFQKEFAKEGLEGHAQHELFRRFLIDMADEVKAAGKQAIVWEGFGRNPNTKFPMPKDLLVMEFESAYYLPTDLLEDGHTVINAAWTPLYVVNRHGWSAEKIFGWNVRRFGRHGGVWPAITWFDAESDAAIAGAQMCSWEQPQAAEVDSLRLKLPAMAEKVWNVNSKLAYLSFAQNARHTDAVLDALIYNVHIQVKGLESPSPDGFDTPSFPDTATVALSPKNKEHTVRYTLDGSRPNASNPVATGPIVINDTVQLRSAAFDADGQRVGFETAAVFYKVPQSKKSLATGKPVRVSGGTQGPQTPELAVDGNLSLSSAWWAAPGPQWLEVDLGKPEEIGRIELVPHWDGSRYYQYRISVSDDQKSWKTLVDASDNTVPANSSGHVHPVVATARYVRVDMLRCSANEGVHIVELHVWPK